ncbi:hypothetical protein Hanom_Chr11g01010441 [Helianthus anomalus]
MLWKSLVKCLISRLPVTNTSKVLRGFASIVMYFVDLHYRFMYIVGHSLFDDFLALILHIYVHYWVSDQWSMQFMRFTIITQVASVLKSFTCIDRCFVLVFVVVYVDRIVDVVRLC